MKKKISVLLIVLLCVLLFPVSIFGHSGRTDSSGGHHDYKNKSGLGSYHYHCGGNPPHLHDGGVCPYSGGSTSTSTSSTTSSYTPPSPSITIGNYPDQLYVGESSGIEYSIDYATDSTSSVTSSNENIVRVNDDKTLTAVAEGVATITISGSGVSRTFDVTVKSVPVSSISVENLLSEIQLGETILLKAVVSPDNATDKSLQWTSSDTSILGVDFQGKIYAKAPGSANITCQAPNGVKADILITVYKVFAEKIETDVASIKLESGKTQKINVTVFPENANNKNYTISVQNPEIVKIEDGFTVRALEDGSTELIITTDNNISTRIPVTVYHIPVESIIIDDSQMDYAYSVFGENIIYVNSAVKLNTKIEPDNATYRNVQWESSNPDVISVKNNQFTVNGIGDVTLTACRPDNTQASIKIKVVSEFMFPASIALLTCGCTGAVGTVLYKKGIKKRPGHP